MNRFALIREALRSHLKRHRHDELEQRERNAYRQRPVISMKRNAGKGSRIGQTARLERGEVRLCLSRAPGIERLVSRGSDLSVSFVEPAAIRYSRCAMARWLLASRLIGGDTIR